MGAKRFISNECGFTLVEAVLAAALLSVLALVVLDLSLRAWGIPTMLGTRTEASTELRNAALWVERDLRRASDVSGGWSNLTLTLGDGTQITYMLSGDELVRISGDSRRAVARSIASASFSLSDGDGGTFVSAVFTSKNGSRMDTGVWVFKGK